VSKASCAGVAVAAVLVLAGCSSTPQQTACRCPTPVAYDNATLHQISQALRALPADNILQRAMQDYENERDDLRFCPPNAGR
jgi:outer membrane murein-binding lipoprotein Lpp